MEFLIVLAVIAVIAVVAVVIAKDQEEAQRMEEANYRRMAELQMQIWESKAATGQPIDIQGDTEKLYGLDKLEQKQKQREETKEIIKGAVVGGVIAGDVGAVVGAVAAKNKVDNARTNQTTSHTLYQPTFSTPSTYSTTSKTNSSTSSNELSLESGDPFAKWVIEDIHAMYLNEDGTNKNEEQFLEHIKDDLEQLRGKIPNDYDEFEKRIDEITLIILSTFSVCNAILISVAAEHFTGKRVSNQKASMTLRKLARENSKIERWKYNNRDYYIL